MSFPEAEKSIQMLEEMLDEIKSGKYTYYIGDVCELNLDKWKLEQVTIRFPYYYDIDQRPSYIVNETPVPFTDKELKIITRNKNGYIDTIKYFEDLIQSQRKNLEIINSHKR